MNKIKNFFENEKNKKNIIIGIEIFIGIAATTFAAMKIYKKGFKKGYHKGGIDTTFDFSYMIVADHDNLYDYIMKCFNEQEIDIEKTITIGNKIFDLYFPKNESE